MKTTKADFPEFFQAYLAAALQDGRNGDPFDSHFSPDDFTDEALETLRAHAFSFWSRMWFYIDHERERGRHAAVAPDTATAGHDFWLTQNGHGAGFWDGDWPVYGEQFSKLSKCYPEINLYITPENKVGVE